MLMLPAELTAKFDHWIAKYPADRQQSAILPILLLVQEYNNGWLSDVLMQQVADYLQMPLVAVYEVATFYTMYELKPVGRYKLNVCTNVSCMLMGSDTIVKHLKQKLAINFNETTPDGKFTLREVECLGACINAPVLHLGHTYYEHLTCDKVDQLLEELA